MATNDWGTFIKRLEKMQTEVERDMAIAVVKAGTVIELRAKEILTEKGHVVTGTLRRSVNTQLGQVTSKSADAIVGTSVIYAKSVEELPVGPRRVKPNRGEGGGFLAPAVTQRIAAAIRVAGDFMERALRKGAR